MVVNESIPMVKVEVVKLNRSKEETESYRAELNKWNEEIYELRHQKEVLEKEKKAEKFNFINLSEKNIKSFCGIGIETFKWILVRAKSYVKRYHLQLTFEHLLLFVLMKTRLGLINGDLTVRFKIHRSRVSKIFRNRIPMLSNVLSSLTAWPERGTIRTNLSASFKRDGKILSSNIHEVIRSVLNILFFFLR